MKRWYPVPDGEYAPENEDPFRIDDNGGEKGAVIWQRGWPLYLEPGMAICREVDTGVPLVPDDVQQAIIALIDIGEKNGKALTAKRVRAWLDVLMR